MGVSRDHVLVDVTYVTSQSNDLTRSAFDRGHFIVN